MVRRVFWSRSPRVCAVLVPGVLGLAGCFDEPPMVPVDGGSTGSTGAMSSGDPTGSSLSTTAEPVTGPGDTTTSGDTTASSDPDTTSVSTGPAECTAPSGQPDAACPDDMPFCVEAQCVSCLDGGDCSAVDPALPACTPEGQCVQCTLDDVSACDPETPVCGDDHTCRACVAHDECPGGAGCQLFEGTCLPDDRVYYVDPDGGCMLGGMASEASPACSVGQALAVAGSGNEATIHVAESVYLENITVTLGAVVAFIGEDEVTFVTNGGPPTVEVLGTAYFDSIDIQNFEFSATGLVSSGDLWLDRSMVRNNTFGLNSTNGRVVLRRTRVVNNGEIGLALSGNDPVVLENVVVAGNGFGSGASGLVVGGPAPLSILYSTLVHNAGSSGGSISCAGAGGTVRNSIVASEGLSNSIACAGMTVTHSVVADAEFSGDPTNIGLAAYGDLLLDENFEVAKGSVAADVAQWDDGDPLTDLYGAPRPGVAGAPDYAGADLPN